MLAERLGCTPEYLADGIEPEQRAHLEVRERLAELARLDGDPSGALDILDEVLTRSDDADVTARARWTRAQALADLGRTEASIKAFEELRDQAERDPGQGCWLPFVIALARCYHQVGDLGEAIALGERALDRLTEVNLTIGPEHAEVGRVLMLAYVDRNELARARELGRSLLAGSAENSPATPAPPSAPESLPVAYRNAATNALESGAVGDALYFAERAVEAHGDTDARSAKARLDVAGARALLRGVTSYGLESPDAAPKGSLPEGASELSAPQEALALLRSAAPLLTGADARECSIETARALVLLGKVEQAVVIAEQAIADVAQHRIPVQSAELSSVQARIILARAKLAGSDVSGALASLKETFADLDQLPRGREVAHAFRELGDLFDSAGDPSGATTAYRRALEAAGLRPSRPQNAHAAVS
jgi:tetratricopeptide (TPR) repeat protein